MTPKDGILTRDGSRKLKVLDALESAIAQGREISAQKLARSLNVSPAYVQLLAQEHGLRRALVRRQPRTQAVDVTVYGIKTLRSVEASPYLRLSADVVRGAGFTIGETVIARADAGRILIMRRPA